MIRRLLDVLRRRPEEQAPARQVRPNELRRDVVQAERRRREAAQGAVRGSVLPSPGEEERAPRERVAPLPEARPRTERPLVRVLRSRSGLRAAWLATEVLGPPAALRGMRDDDLAS